MKELKCPRCGSVFSVDESDYATILSQVKNVEFDKEVSRRMKEVDESVKARLEAENARLTLEFDRRMATKDREAAELRLQIEKLNARIEGSDTTARLNLERELSLRNEVHNKALAEKDRELSELRSKLATASADTKLAVAAEKDAAGKSIMALDREISRLKLDVESEKRAAAEREENMRQGFKFQLDEKDRLIGQLRDMKLRMSTKMVGESLEQHCYNEFNTIRSLAFPLAYFDKDNDASGGSKGDFIFRDYDDGEEYISIMFEMKNEMDTTATKHRNEDFFEKLDRDRKAKNCEYAVLVSLLEADSDYYNAGIVDVSYRYDKMYVIRPQFFIPVISLLSRASKKSMLYKRQLELARSQSVDVTNFEIKLEGFKADFSRHVEASVSKYEDAIGKIDSAIRSLENIKKLFQQSERQLQSAESVLTKDLTIRKLTYMNPTMRDKFREAREATGTEGAQLPPADNI